MARQPALKPRSIGVLIFEDFQLLDAAGPIGAFEMPMRGMQPPPYSLQVIAPAAGAFRSSSGVVWMAEAMPRQPRYDTVVIAGGIGARAAMSDPKVQAFVRAAMKTARRGLLGRLHPRPGRRTGRQARHHPLGPHARFPETLPRRETRARLHLHP